MSQDIATPSSPDIATKGNLYDALYDFVAMYAIPVMDGNNIFFSNRNRMSLPSGHEEYAVIDVLSSVRHGTATEKLIPGNGSEPDKLVIGSLFEYLVQVDLYSVDETARQRAMTLANVGMRVGPQFFNQYGCSFLYMDNPRDMAFVGDANQYVQRWMLTLRVTMPELTTVELPGFDSVAVERIENVDVHHPPTED